MGSIRKFTKAERAQRERDQQAPEYLEWLDRGESDLARFFAEDAPEIGALGNPWTMEGIQLVSAKARETFDPASTVQLPEHLHIVDRFRRYIGEAYIRSFEGHWRNVPANCDLKEPTTLWPETVHPFRNEFMDPHQLLFLSFIHRPNHPEGELPWVYGNFQRSYNGWVAAGRPSADEWEEIEFKALLARARENKDK